MIPAPAIEHAALCDVPALLELTADCVARMREQGIEQWDEVYPSAQIIIHDIAAGTQWVLRDGAEIAGCLTLDERQDPLWADLHWRHTVGRIGAVHRVMIAPSHQGRGLAKQLMRFAENHATANGFAALRLDAFTKNPASLALYERLGYARAGTAMMRKGEFIGFEKVLPDAS